MGYPKPQGYSGSGKDGNMVRTGSGGRKALDPFDHDNNSDIDWRTDYRRNESEFDSFFAGDGQEDPYINHGQS